MIAPDQTIAERYIVKTRIGRGGFATVFLAHDLNFERDIALKAISAQESDNQEHFFTAFVQEARLVAKLLHPNILDVYDYGRVGSEGYLVMPYANDGTLAGKLRQRGPLPLPDALVYFRQMAAGLAYAHQRNIIHRDMKPQNMLLFKDGRLVISDFGLARVLSETSGMTNTRVTGTPLYMAPEQWVGQAGKATDIYALGIIFYQLLTGNVPFQGENQSQLFFQHTNQPLPPITQTRPDLPPGLELFLAHLTAKPPADRPQAADLVQLLDQALATPADQPGNDPVRSYNDLRENLRQRQTEGDATLSYVEGGSATQVSNLDLPTEPLDSIHRKPGATSVATPSQARRSAQTISDTPAGQVRVATPRPVRKRRLIWSLAVAIVAVLAALVGGVILLWGRVSDAGKQPAYPDAADITYPPPSANGGSSVGRLVYGFTAPSTGVVDFDQSGQFVMVDVGLDPVRKLTYRNLVKGNVDDAREKLPLDAIFSPDRKHAVVFQSYTTNVRTLPPSGNAPTPTPTAQEQVDIGELVLYRTDTYDSVLKVGNVVRRTKRASDEIAFTPDSKILAFTYRGDAIGFIDLTNDKLMTESLAGENPGRGKTLDGDTNVLFHYTSSYDDPFSPDGRFLRVADVLNPDPKAPYDIYLYDLRPLQTGGSLLGARPVLTGTLSLVYSPDGKHAVKRSDRDNSNYALFSIENGNFTRVVSLPGAYKDNVPPDQPGHVYYSSPIFLNNDVILANTRSPETASSANPQEAFVTYSAKDGSMLGSFQGGGHYYAARDYRFLISVPDTIANPDKTKSKAALGDLTFYDMLQRKPIGTIPGIHKTLGLSYDDKILVTSTADGHIELYDTATYQKVATLSQQFSMTEEGSISAYISICKTGPFLLIKDEQRHVTLWRLE